MNRKKPGAYGRAQSLDRAVRVGFLSAICASLAFAAPAYGQTSDMVSSNDDQPVATASDSVETKISSMPLDLRPEKLNVVPATVVNPYAADKIRRSGENRWDPATLTQTTGLNAARLRQSIKASPAVAEQDGKQVSTGVLASDLLSAEDLLNVGEIKLPSVKIVSGQSTGEDGVVELSSTLKGTLFNTPTDNINASVFKLDLGQQLCLGTAEECQGNELNKLDLGYAKSITHGKFEGLNLQLTPRAGLRFNDDSKSAVVGALVRIGDNLRDGAEMKSNTWYFFAGADAEALTYTPGAARRLTSGDFHLQDRIIVGDAQAGVGYRIGDADLALTYFKRQATAEDYSYDEDAAALSLTWKR